MFAGTLASQNFSNALISHHQVESIIDCRRTLISGEYKFKVSMVC